MRTDPPTASKPAAPGFSTTLLTWFDREQRPLPWRQRRTPYRVWVAEVLLQQTRVAQAERYFRRFMARFPTLSALAAARQSSVLKVWEGAGYYGRARRLWSAARIVTRTQGGKLPSEVSALEELPGFGPYIARAVAAVAFRRPVYPFEANGARVAARLTGEMERVTDLRVRRRLEAWLTREMPRPRPGDFAEAIMELGETVCRPRSPRCEECPVAPFCVARQTLPEPGVIPMRGPKRTVPHVRGSVVALRAGPRWLVHRRSKKSLLGGLWEFPGGKIETGESPLGAAVRELREETGLEAPQLRSFGVLHHAYSHFAVDLHLFQGSVARARGIRGHGKDFRWVTAAEFNRLPRPMATIRAAQRVGLCPTGPPRSQPPA
ncbi:MAG: NUDIX domain-containing protein [Thermoplasmata archaeon]